MDNVAQKAGSFGGLMEARPLLSALMEKQGIATRLGASGIVSFSCEFPVTAAKVADEEGLVMSQ